MRALLLFTILFTSPFIFCQEHYILEGKISDINGPVPFATVLIKNTSEGTQADENGYFKLNTSLKTATVEVQAMGYLPFSKKVSFEKNKPIYIEIYLQAAPEELNAVLIIDKQSGLTRRTPYALTHVEMQHISQSSNPGGIAGVLKEQPGISGAELGPGIVKPFIRGLGFSRVVTLYQNNKLENHAWGQDHGLGLNSLGIKSVDVIKGPASILYGSGAIGGVLIVKDNESYLTSEKSTGNIGVTFNSTSNGFRNYGSLGKKFQNNLFFAIDAAYENHADYKNGENRIIGNSRFNYNTLRLHTGIDKKNYKNKLSFTYQKQNLGIIDDNELEETLATSRNDRKMQLPFQEVSDYLISFSEERFRESFQTFFHLSHHFNDRNEIEEDFNEIDLGIKQNHTFLTGRISLFPESDFTHTFGVQASLINTKNTEEAKEILIPDARTKDIGVYYLGSKLLDKFYFQGGLRFDYRNVEALANSQALIDYGFILPGNPESRKLSTNFSGFTGSLGVSYRFNTKNQIKLNTSTGFRAPDLAELFSNGPHPGTSRFEVGNANFKREQSLQTDLTYTFTRSSFDLGASIYVNDISNYIFFINTGEIRPEDSLEIWAFQQENALLYGTEWEVKYRPLENSDLQLRATAALVRGELKDPKENLTFIPADQYGFDLSYKPYFSKRTHFTAAISHTAKQNRPGFNEMSTPAFTLVHTGISHDFIFEKGTLSTSLQLRNLFNKNYVDHLSILRAFEITNPGRNLQLAVRYEF
ncbi:MAG: TonB-dependent receptor [Flavobacteriaceae bacterium]|nr:TonB-dependent receptor [Flavobacteriaceae bacterium]